MEDIAQRVNEVLNRFKKQDADYLAYTDFRDDYEVQQVINFAEGLREAVDELQVVMDTAAERVTNGDLSTLIYDFVWELREQVKEIESEAWKTVKELETMEAA